LTSFSRAIGAAAIVAAAALTLGGAYFVGYVGELQRALNDPAETRSATAQQTAAIEQALGYAGFLKTYRNYRLTGDATARLQLTRHAIDAERALTELKKLYAGNPRAADMLREVENVGEAFAHVAQTAGDAIGVLRGSRGNELLLRSRRNSGVDLALRTASIAWPRRIKPLTPAWLPELEPGPHRGALCRIGL
jgi:hypothetical protein